MYQIGICDDAEGVCATLRNMILRFARTNQVYMETKVWHDGEKLCDYLKEGGPLDLLFLDIILLNMSGVEAGDFIRNSLADRKMQIIYISEQSSRALELFRVQPMEFLVKPIRQEQVDRCLKLALELIGMNRKEFSYRNGRDVYSVSCGEILYFTSEGRKVKIITEHGVKEFNGKLKDVMKELPEQFLVIHKSYIVNRARVLHYTYECAEFPDGTILSISKAYRKQVREALGRRR